MLILWYNYEIIQLQKGLNRRTSKEILNAGSIFLIHCPNILYMTQVSDVAHKPLAFNNVSALKI